MQYGVGTILRVMYKEDECARRLFVKERELSQTKSWSLAVRWCWCCSLGLCFRRCLYAVTLVTRRLPIRSHAILNHQSTCTNFGGI